MIRAPGKRHVFRSEACTTRHKDPTTIVEGSQGGPQARRYRNVRMRARQRKNDRGGVGAITRKEASVLGLRT
jgi:hypothetical protein